MGVVRPRMDRLGNVVADLGVRDIEGGGYLDVADMIAAEIGVHEPGDGLVSVGITVVGQPLDEGGGAVPHADEADADLPRTHDCTSSGCDRPA